MKKNKFLISFAIVVMLFSFTTMNVMAEDTTFDTESSNENCLANINDVCENIKNKVLEFFGITKEQEEMCPGCSFDVESQDTRVWLAYIDEEYYQVEITPLKNGLKNVRIKKVENLKKTLFEIPEVKDIQIYGVSFFLLKGNNQLMEIDVTNGNVIIISGKVSKLVWIGMNGNKLAYEDENGKLHLIENVE